MKHSRQENSSRRLRKQTVVFVRHGVARHNIINPQTGKPPDLTDPNLLDPPLVRDGKFQAIIVGERLKAWWINEQGSDAQLVISSPLTRCLQTANLAYLPGDLYPMGRNEPTIVCMEGVREAYGMHYPDKRRNKSFLEVSESLLATNYAAFELSQEPHSPVSIISTTVTVAQRSL